MNWTGRPIRRGFTIPELLIATALTMVIMVILTGAFSIGLETFRQMRGVASIAEQLRNATVTLRRDLAAPHFGPGPSGSFPANGTGGPHLADQRLDMLEWTPPAEGFFRIWQGLPGGVPYQPIPGLPGGTVPEYLPANLVTSFEGNDPLSGLRSWYSFTHALHFTVKLSGRTESDTLSAQIAGGNSVGSANDNFLGPGTAPPPVDLNLQQQSLSEFRVQPNRFTTDWAEIAYYLKPTGDWTGGAAGQGLPLFSLRRRQLLLLPSGLGRDGNLAVGASTDNRRCLTNGGVNHGIGLGNQTNLNFEISQRQNISRVFVDQAAAGPFNMAALLGAGGNRYNSPTTVRHPERRFSASMFPNTINLVSPVVLPPPATTQVIGEPPHNAGLPHIQQAIGSDILLTDVLSFVVKVRWTNNPALNTFTQANGLPGVESSPAMPPLGGSAGPPVVPPNVDFPFADLPLGCNPGFATRTRPTAARVFDTWVDRQDFLSAPDTPALPPAPNNADYSQWNVVDTLLRVPAANRQPRAFVPLRIRVLALLIELRVWDRATQQTRQITIIQDV